MTDSNGPSTSQSANRQKPEQTLTTDLIVRLIASNVTPLQDEIKNLRPPLHSSVNIVTENHIKQINYSITCGDSLEVVRSLP